VIAQPRLSICICTYKRPEGLVLTLSSIAAMAVPENLSVEIIVVDNDPAGTAASVIESGQIPDSWTIRKFVESKAGVGYARNRCIQEASGEWIAFVDDDEIVSHGWLTALWGQAAKSAADGVFGPVAALLPNSLPVWHRGSGFFERRHGSSGQKMEWKNCASGNVLIKRSLLLACGGFSTEFARTGAEDTDMFRRCADAGAKLVWCQEALIEESIHPNRLTRRWAWLRSYIGGQNYARLIRRHDGVGAFSVVIFRGILGGLLYALPAVLLIPISPGTALRFQSQFCANVGKAVGWIAGINHYGTPRG
jgi:succinoglycan biosynthesis protein ExoM